jgi:hypothetical protein
MMWMLFSYHKFTKFHGFVLNLCEIYYFMDLYCLNMNVVHYLNTKIMCMIFMGELTQINIQHLYLNDTNKN